MTSMYTTLLLFVFFSQVEYSRKEIRALLQTLDSGNRTRLNHRGPIGLKRSVSAFGIVGKLQGTIVLNNNACI